MPSSDPQGPVPGPPRPSRDSPFSSVLDVYGDRYLARWWVEWSTVPCSCERAGIQLRLTATRHERQGAGLDLPVAGNREGHLGIALQAGPETFVRVDEIGPNLLAQALDVFVQAIGLEVAIGLESLLLLLLVGNRRLPRFRGDRLLRR
jgi:hypothetical protein